MLQLSNGQFLPELGVGTWTLRGDTATESVSAALKAGFRLIDTARMYGNEDEVSNDMMRKGQEAVSASIVKSLDNLEC